MPYIGSSRYKYSPYLTTHFGKTEKFTPGDAVSVPDEQTGLPAIGLLPGDLFGQGMAISADRNTLAVGASSRDASFANQGSVFVFTRNGGTWLQQAEIFATEPFFSEGFGATGGIALSADGNTLAIGSPQAIDYYRGCVYVYTRSGSTWTFQQKISSSTGQDYADFGESCALSDDGNVLVIGEPKQNAGGTERGRVHVYTRVDGVWSLDNYFGASTPVNSGRFGFGVSVSANGVFIAVGAPGDFTNGRCYLFENVSGTWTQRAIHVPTVSGNILNTLSFGTNMVISPDGTMMLACAPSGNVKNSSGTSIFGGPGWARLLTYSAGSFITTATFIASSPQNTDNMGSSVSVDWDSGRIALGSLGYDAPSKTNAGRVHIFTNSGVSWSETKVIERAVSQAQELFGAGVALYGNKVAVGVPQAGPSFTGAVDLVGAV